MSKTPRLSPEFGKLVSQRFRERPLWRKVAEVAIILLARLEGESSNALFDELADWNHQLKHTKTDLRGPRP